MSYTNRIHASLLRMKLDLLKPQMEMMQNPVSWPCWPFLALRRRASSGSQWELGVLFDGANYCKSDQLAYTVFQVNITQIGTSIPTHATLLKQRSLQYGSFEELLAAGWRID